MSAICKMSLHENLIEDEDKIHELQKVVNDYKSSLKSKEKKRNLGMISCLPVSMNYVVCNKRINMMLFRFVIEYGSLYFCYVLISHKISCLNSNIYMNINISCKD